jgi:hypothetical protein
MRRPPFLTRPTSSDAQSRTLVLQWSGTDAEGWTADWNITPSGPSHPNPGATVGGTSSSLSGTSGVLKDAVMTAANNPAGAGGRGHRHYRTGHNDHGGGMEFHWAGDPAEIWLRYYIRFSTGWDTQPTYTKDWYFDGAQNPVRVIGHQGGAWGVVFNNNAFPSSEDWTDTFGGSTSDGLFHLHEYHLNCATGLAEIWIDEAQVLSQMTGQTFASFGDKFASNNQDSAPASGDHYTDYDDIAISIDGYIGPYNASRGY